MIEIQVNHRLNRAQAYLRICAKRLDAAPLQSTPDAFLTLLIDDVLPLLDAAVNEVGNLVSTVKDKQSEAS